MKVTKNTKLAKVLELPKGEKILAKYNLPCLFCPFAEAEIDILTVEDVCKMYGINLENLLKDLNKKNNSKI